MISVVLLESVSLVPVVVAQIFMTIRVAFCPRPKREQHLREITVCELGNFPCFLHRHLFILSSCPMLGLDFIAY